MQGPRSKSQWRWISNH